LSVLFCVVMHFVFVHNNLVVLLSPLVLYYQFICCSAKILCVNYIYIRITLFITLVLEELIQIYKLGHCRGRNHIVVGFTTTYAISAYHH
jgi:hypothetical protein